MLDSQWITYKAMIRAKFRDKPKALADAEITFKWFENAAGKFDIKKWQEFIKKKTSRMPQKEKDIILEDTKAEMKKQGFDKEHPQGAGAV